MIFGYFSIRRALRACEQEKAEGVRMIGDPHYQTGFYNPGTEVYEAARLAERWLRPLVFLGLVPGSAGFAYLVLMLLKRWWRSHYPDPEGFGVATLHEIGWEMLLSPGFERLLCRWAGGANE